MPHSGRSDDNWYTGGPDGGTGETAERINFEKLPLTKAFGTAHNANKSAISLPLRERSHARAWRTFTCVCTGIAQIQQLLP